MALVQHDTSEFHAQEQRPILIRKANKDKVVVWVEGNDWLLYHRFFNQERVYQVSREGGYTCHSTIEGYKAFKKLNPSRKAIVIKDADFARLDGISLTDEPDVFYADGHDHEMMCAKLEAVRKAVFDNIDPNADVESFYNDLFLDIRTLSYFKWYNYRNHCGYAVKDQPSMTESITNLHSLSWIEKRTYNVSLRNLKKHNPHPESVSLEHIDPTNIIALMTKYPNADRYELTNGHDFLSRLNHKLNKKYHITRSDDSYRDLIYTVMTYEFQKTKLYKDLENWCAINKTNILAPAV